MPLILKVVSYKQALPAEQVEARFDQCGGTIGRADQNDLMLLDPEKCISRIHAQLAYDGVNYSLTDKSLAGTFVDKNETPVKGETIQLHDGMRLIIGEYEVAVIIGDDVSSASDVLDNDPYSAVCDTEISPNLASMSDDAEKSDIPGVDDSVDRFSDVDFHSADSFDPPSASPSVRPNEQNACSDGDSGSLFNEQFRPPDVEAALEPFAVAGNGNLNLDDLIGCDVSGEVSADVSERAYSANQDSLSEQSAIKTELRPNARAPFDVSDEFSQPENSAEPAPENQAESAPENSIRQTKGTIPSDSESANMDSEWLLEAFLDGLGLSRKDIADIRSDGEAIQLAGSMLRGMTAGIMALLRRRAEMKSQARLSMTMVRSIENNPLKISASVEDALRVMLNPDRKGFLPALEAINNAVNDITNHQLALAAGTQAALVDLLQGFDPHHFEEPFKNGISFGKKGKSWDNYAKQYKAKSTRAIEEFFGDEFVRAYEEQLRKLELKRDN